MLNELFAAAGAAAWGGVAFRRLLPFLSTEALEKVEALCPRPKTVLAAAFPYYAGERPGNLSLYARGEDYHTVVVRRLNTVCEALAEQYPGESFFPSADNSPLPEREAACPAGAMGEGGPDVSRCLSELTQKKGALTGEEEARLKAHPLIWGCDFCQRACPFNADPALSPLPEFSTDLVDSLENADLEGLTNRTFREKYGGRAFAWRGPGPLRRNLELKRE